MAVSGTLFLAVYERGKLLFVFSFNQTCPVLPRFLYRFHEEGYRDEEIDAIWYCTCHIANEYRYENVIDARFLGIA